MLRQIGVIRSAGGDSGTLPAAPLRKDPRHTVPAGMTLPEEAMRPDKALRRALRSARLTAGAGKGREDTARAGIGAAGIVAADNGGPQTEPVRSDD